MRRALGRVAAVLMMGAAGGTLLSAGPVRRPDGLAMDRFVFHAVLEGLYDDGVQKDVVRSVLGPAKERPPAAGQKRDRTFVDGCAICAEVRNAFQSYAAAPDLHFPYKTESDRPGFGEGLQEFVVSKFVAGDAKSRLAALEDLIQRYVKRRFERVRLTDEEKREIEVGLEQAAKSGMAVMLSQREAYPDFEDRCPSCRGATSGIH